MATEQKERRSDEESLKLLTGAVWRADGNDGDCPPEKVPEFRQLDDRLGREGPRGVLPALDDS